MKRKTAEQKKLEKYYADYQKAAKYQNFGFKVSKKSLQKLSPQQKGAITKARNRQKDFQGLVEKTKKGTGGSYKFVEASRGQLAKLKKQFPNQTTNKGVFIKFPELRGKKTKRVEINQEGETTVEIQKRRQVFIPLSPAEYARNPEGAILEKLEGRPAPDAIGFTVENYTADRQYSMQGFLMALNRGYITNTKKAFQREADKRGNEAPRLTGLVLTYNRKIKSREIIDRDYLWDNAPELMEDENEPF